MRFLISIDDQWQVTYTCPAQPAWRRNRRLERRDVDDGAFPLPPETERPAPGSPHAALCAGDAAALRQARADIVDRRITPEAPERFGRYLFDTLIGPALWQEMLDLARDASMIELALALAPGERDLHRLNSELMHGPDGFLAAGRPRPVAITRVIAGAAATARRIESPPRVLFLVGTSLTDPEIRAGAEFLGLLRRIEADGRSIHPRILERASTDRAKQAVESFRPDVVHIIAHGDVDRGMPYLEFELNVGENDPARRRVFASRLVEVLNADGRRAPPPIVVLSACNTAVQGTSRVLGPQDTAPLAAQLVEAGVPVVIGMAGRISDRACRHFTRRFGQALVRGETLVEATEQGRRAAFAGLDGPVATVDWAFPAVYLAAGVDWDYKPVDVDPAVPDLSVELERRIALYGQERAPVFCGRQNIIQTYYRLFEDPTRRVLAAYTEKNIPDIGRTRLLAELIGQAVRDGNVPCLMTVTKGDDAFFANSTALTLHVVNAIGNACEIFGLQPPLDSEVLATIRGRDPTGGYDRILARNAGRRPEIVFRELLAYCRTVADDCDIDSDTIRTALQLDLKDLTERARDAHDYIKAANGRAVAFFDDVHLYDRGITALFDELLGPTGLGTTAEPVPVILVLSLGGHSHTILHDRVVKQPAPWLEPVLLEPFRKDGEDLLACARVLLHPFKPSLLAGVSDRPLAVNEGVDPQLCEIFEANFRNILGGLPSRFSAVEFYGAASIALKHRYLTEANDEQLVQAMIRGDA